MEVREADSPPRPHRSTLKTNKTRRFTVYDGATDTYSLDERPITLPLTTYTGGKVLGMITLHALVILTKKYVQVGALIKLTEEQAVQMRKKLPKLDVKRVGRRKREVILPEQAG